MDDLQRISKASSLPPPLPGSSAASAPSDAASAASSWTDPAAASEALRQVIDRVEGTVIGQRAMVERLVLALLTGGHVLLEGLPGLAKTLAVKTLCQSVQASFKRIQFTPDLLPADILGTVIYNPKTSLFSVKKGPVFAHLVLADEVNRAPAKVQSALLEAMQEKQVTLGEETFALPRPFLVIATQNPLEQEGTYALPEAQVDRFLFHVRVDYPNAADELAVMRAVVPREIDEAARSRVSTPPTLPTMTPDMLLGARQALTGIHLDERIERYIVDLVVATRPGQAQAAPGTHSPNGVPRGAKPWHRWLDVGASPRASLGLNLSARARAFLDGRDYVTPDDIKSLAPDVLRHRLLLSYEAESDGVSADDVVSAIVEATALP